MSASRDSYSGSLQKMDCLDDVFRLLEKAKLLEKDGQRIEASTKYYEGCHLMRQIISNAQFPQGEKDLVVDLLREKIQFYTQQAQRLYFDEESVMPPTLSRRMTTPATITLAAKSDEVSVLSHTNSFPGSQPSVFTEMHRKMGIGNARMGKAIFLEEEEMNNQKRDKETIIQTYLSAAEAYLSVVRLSEASSLSLPPIVQSRLEACLDRIEVLKKRPIGRETSHPVDKGIT